MAKAYWITCYHKVTDAEKLANYARLAAPAIQAGGGRFLARGAAAKAYEHGKLERTVLIEFDSVEDAVAVHDSAAYQEALAALGDGAVRDMRIVPRRHSCLTNIAAPSAAYPVCSGAHRQHRIQVRWDSGTT